MYYLYILKSKINNKHYIGITANIEKRIIRHNNGSVKSTKAYRPYILIHIESFNNKRLARQRELFLKNTAKARQELIAKIDGLIV